MVCPSSPLSLGTRKSEAQSKSSPREILRIFFCFLLTLLNPGDPWGTRRIEPLATENHKTYPRRSTCVIQSHTNTIYKLLERKTQQKRKSADVGQARLLRQGSQSLSRGGDNIHPRISPEFQSHSVFTGEDSH